MSDVRGKSKDPVTLVIAEKVAEVRVRSGLTMQHAAQAAGIGGTTWSDVENGHRGVSVVVLSKMAKALGTTIAYLVGESAKDARDEGVQEGYEAAVTACPLLGCPQKTEGKCPKA